MITFKPFFLITAVLTLSACTAAKLEARLEANPQCKDVVNPKTGSLMPCPGSDKAFYASVGLAPTKSNAAISNTSSSATQSPDVASTSTVAPKAPSNSTATTTPAFSAPIDCKPQIHKKTGGTLPCPAAD